MKKVSRYILVFVIFALVMSGILIYFSNAKEKINKINDGKKLLKYIYTLKEGNYSLKEGILYNENDNVISSEYYFDGNGNITKDKYNNVSFNIELDNKCLSKTSMGDITLSKKCNSEQLEVIISKNNDKVSFTSNIENIYYKISSSDDFKGEWTQIEGSSHMIKDYYSGTNYIWFKTESGTLYETKSFKIECLDASSANYDNSVYYCVGSTVYLDNMPWLVVDSNTKNTTLMLVESLDTRLQMCLDEENNNYCYYTKNNSNQFTWSKSYVKYYVNEVFSLNLSEETKSLLEETKICDDYSITSCEDNTTCGGRLESELVSSDYTCSKYTTSKVRLLTFDEYTHLANNSEKYSLYISNYWILNGYEANYASSVEQAGNVFVRTNPTTKLNVKPVITLRK